MLYDPDDPNQSLYKGNMSRPMDFCHVESIGMVRGRKITRTISDPRGISREEYQSINLKAVTAFGSVSTVTTGTWPDNKGYTKTGAPHDFFNNQRK